MQVLRLERAARPVPFPYALACHAALRDILGHSLRRACELGLYSFDEAGELFRLAVAQHSGVLRATCELVLGAVEAARSGNVRHE
jgi:hypothetical protein